MTAAPNVEPTPLDHALAYAARGWRVIPLPPGTKHPAIAAWQREGTTDTGRITHWWTQAPTHGISIVTGAESRLWVLDVDIADSKTGDDTLRELEDGYTELPPTFEVVTGSGGRHLYFNWPANGQTIRNSASGRLGPGLDVRGEGGHVVAPPSVHPNGRAYQHEASAPIAVADAPGWLLALLADPEPVAPRTPAPATGDRPGDLWAAATTWDQLLEADGWTLHHIDRSGEQHWTRPGKDRRDGTSATVGYQGSDIMKMFSSSVPELAAEATYTKLGYLAATRHDGDHSAAATALRSAGWKTTSADSDVRSLIGDQGPAAASSSATGTATVEPPTPGQDWPTPIPLGSVTELPPFPIHVLPDWIANYTLEVADDIQVPVDLPATLAIGALSTLASGHLKIQVAGAWTEHANLFLVVAMPPSTGKSPSYKAMCSPVLDLEREYQLQMRATVSANADMVDAIEGELKRAKQLLDVDVKSLAEIRGRLHNAQDEQTTLPKLTIGDATPEALEVLLAQNGGRMAVHSTEGGVFSMMTGRYSESSNLDVYLQGWSGDRLDSSRISREANQTDEALLTMVLTVQPKVISDLADRPELAGRGLTARFMYSMPPDVLGQRDLRLRHGTAASHRDAYSDQLRTLGRRFLSWNTPATISLNQDAAQHYTDWRQALEARRTVTGDLRPMAEWTGKLESSVLRLAAILHFAHGHDHSDHATLTTMTQALSVGEYWLAHAGHVHDLWGTSPEITSARKVADWADTLKGSTFTVRDLYATNRTTFKKADETLPALTLLTERGWIRTEDGGPVATQRNKRSVVFEVHPEISTVSARSARSVLRRVTEALPLSFEPGAGEGARQHAAQNAPSLGGTESDTATESHAPPPTPPGDGDDLTGTLWATRPSVNPTTEKRE